MLEKVSESWNIIIMKNIMKSQLKKSVGAFALAVFAVLGSGNAYAQSLSDLLGGTLGSTLGNVVEGVFTKSDLSVDDIAGEWTSQGSAVSFQGDNFLKKAGGLAAAGVVESKLNPYYEKVGLDGAVLTVKDDGTFSLKAKKFSMSGTLESNGDGTFTFNFKAFGKISLGKVKTYVQKSGKNMDVMFDATKLKSLLSGVASVTGISMAKTAASVLDSYDGMCVGFKMSKTGEVESTKPQSSSSAGASSVKDALGKILGGGSSSSSSAAESEPATAEPETSTSEPTKANPDKTSVSNALKNIFGK